MTTENGVYTPSSTPKPHPRVKPEAEEYANRNRGGMDKWFDYSQNTSYESPRPMERLRSDDARRNATTNKGCMGELLGGYADPPAERKVHPRGVTGDAAETAQNNKGGAMKNLIANYGNLSVESKPAPKVKGDYAEEYAERNHNGKMETLINHYGTLTPEQPPAPKVSYGGEEVAEKYKGAGMGPLLRQEEEAYYQEPKVSRLHQASEGPGWDENPPAYRTRPEAEGIAEKNSETYSDKLMRGEVMPPTVRTPKLPIHMQESESPRPVTSPLRTRPEGITNFQRNQNGSEMAAIMRGENTNSSAPKKMNRNLVRSELW
ncbi:uncharacterized protein LOC117342844 [Pecten maximus]|uniref:uncharacterized protein LOC117342844 n=1 Tax=Pecten maximus TaxID=6579 RepID=UPI001459127B|nr:uncharacterized protein LOC117342844 [Pecten maximus]XP_033761004.1 uncharacterized protein LOC117342844 [Pecten maximus]XP_033761005.1 uncharacterized protein LOC117342844 [Pecten maximus]XP_033761006.1 uncharacterized protein LOC117342844 [Pecten maximus]XP_033761007.1 uncharacterized protein LOC117342844 [Pecten maximus]